MKKQNFITNYYPFALKAGEHFKLNPVVILTQAAVETGWGKSKLATLYHNFFGITGKGMHNPWWDGKWVAQGDHGLTFRVYPNPENSFMDYGRLITSAYKSAAEMSFHPEAFAKEIAYSPYINPENGDNREGYRKMMVSIARDIENQLSARQKEGSCN